MGVYSKLVHRKEIEENIFEIKYSLHDSGSCQCSKDCDCSSKRGQLLGYETIYSNGVLKKPNGKERTYKSIEIAKSALEAHYKKNQNKS